MRGKVTEPIKASLDELADAVVSSNLLPNPSLRKQKKKQRNSLASKTIASLVAEHMWNADERPCSWSDLDKSEQAEWEVMAKAAITLLEALPIRMGFE